MPTDKDHCEITNRLIATMNAMMDEGYDADFVASAAVAAAGAFTAFNLSGGGRMKVLPTDIQYVAAQFAGRVREAARAQSST